MRAFVSHLLAIAVAATLVALSALAMFAPAPQPGTATELTTLWSQGDPHGPRSRAFGATSAAGPAAALTR